MIWRWREGTCLRIGVNVIFPDDYIIAGLILLLPVLVWHGTFEDFGWGGPSRGWHYFGVRLRVRLVRRTDRWPVLRWVWCSAAAHWIPFGKQKYALRGEG